MTITYDASGHPSQVTDSWGTVALQLTTNASGRVTQIDVSGRTDLSWKYQYSADYSETSFRITATYTGPPAAGVPHTFTIDQGMNLQEGP